MITWLPSYLKLVLSPHDNVSLRRVINVPARGIGKGVMESLEGIERIARIVAAMKEFSHPGQERTPTDINHAIANTITVATNEWKYVATVQTDFDPAMPQVPVIPGEFNQVILNLIVNAIDAMSDMPKAERKITIRR